MRRRSNNRHLTTVVFTDMVGSTQRAIEVGDEAWRSLLARYHRAVRAQIRRFGGRQIDEAGDGFLISFPQPAQAVRAALAIHSAVAPLNIRLRSGIHTGEVGRVESKVGGIALHLAARVTAAAEPGQILVTSTVRDLVVGSELIFEDGGRRQLKGFDGAWQVFSASAGPRDQSSVVLNAGGDGSFQPRQLAVAAGLFGAVAGIAVILALGFSARPPGSAERSDMPIPIGSSSLTPSSNGLPAGLSGEIAMVMHTAAGSGGIVLLDLSTGRFTRLTSDPSDAEPAWSPDGQQLAFTRGAGPRKALYVLDTFTNDLRRVVADIVSVHSPGWWGKRIVFVKCCGNGGFGGVSIVDLETGEVEPVQGPAGRLRAALLVPEGLSVGQGFEGIAVSFETWPSGLGNGEPERRLWLIDPTTGDWQSLVEDGPSEANDPSWSSLGTLAFTAAGQETDDRYLYIFLDSDTWTKLTDTVGIESAPTWSPDDAWIAYSAGRDSDGQIFIVSPDGHSRAQLTDGNPGTSYADPAWRP
jgi:class 3 adenylate cyclase